MHIPEVIQHPNVILLLKRRYIIYGIICLAIILPILLINSSASKSHSPSITITKSLVKLTEIISSTTTIQTTSTKRTTISNATNTVETQTMMYTSEPTSTTLKMDAACDIISESHNLNISGNPCEQIRCAVILRRTGGRLGNRMFIFASAYGLARTQNCRLHVSDAILKELSDNFRMKLIDERMWLSYNGYSKLNDIRTKDTVCTFLHELVRPNAFKNLELTGYWQSYLYFDAYREEIRDIFSGRNDTLAHVAQYFTKIAGNFCISCPPLPTTSHKELREAFRTQYNITWISIHIRGTDFRGIGYASDEDYIRRAMIYFRRRYYYQRVRFLVASDDKSHCDEIFARQKKLHQVFILPYEFTMADDMIALTMCHHSIVTGGTYSFWTAYLAGGEVIHDIKYQAVCPRADYYPPWFVLVGRTIEKKD